MQFVKRKPLVHKQSSHSHFIVCMQRAEFCAFCNCVMDRTTLDATLSDSPGKHSIHARPDVAGGAHIPLTDSQFSDLITVHLADWLEQVCLDVLEHYMDCLDQLIL